MPRKQERQVFSMPSWIGEERNRSLLHQWVQHDAIMSWRGSWLGPLASGHVLSPIILLIHFFFPLKAMQQVPHCTMKSSTCRSMWGLLLPLYLLQVLNTARPALIPECPPFRSTHTHTKPTRHKYPFLSFLYLSAKTTATSESFYSFGRGKEVHKLCWSKQLMWNKSLWITARITSKIILLSHDVKQIKQ